MNMIINGKRVPAISGRTIQIRNPATGELVDSVPQAGPEDVELAIEVGCKGRAVMRGLPAHRRSEILRLAANEIEKRHEELSQLLCKENGKTIRQCRYEMT